MGLNAYLVDRVGNDRWRWAMAILGRSLRLVGDLDDTQEFARWSPETREGLFKATCGLLGLAFALLCTAGDFQREMSRVLGADMSEIDPVDWELRWVRRHQVRVEIVKAFLAHSDFKE